MSNNHTARGRFRGRTAVVTGASRGIGLAVAELLVSEGARVCLTARKAGPLEEASAALPPGSVVTVAGRADDPEHRREVFDTVAREFGGLDVLATLAWVQDAAAHPELDFAERSGSVVNLSSVTGETPSPGIDLYGVSKAAVSHLTRTLAVELGPAIRVNAVAPAVVKTRFAEALYEGKEDEVAGGYPMKRLGLPADIASAVAYLASDQASWVTGHVLTVDGGLTAAGGTA